MGRRVLRFDGPLARGWWWRPSGADYKKAGPRPLVISTEAGQPPIGKPLIVQARGQLRLTWRLYAESPQSGEISPLSWYGQHYGGRSLDSEHHGSGSCLSPITARSPARDDDGSGRHWTHLRCEGSEGVEGSEGKVLRIDRPYGPEGS